jgi:peptidyl-prolyl cis-trans isomerase A (cyclophilin A)
VIIVATQHVRGLALFLLISVICLRCADKAPSTTNPLVVIETNYGDIYVELYPKQAPITVAAFLKYVDSGYYKNSSFYRVLTEENQSSESFKSELIQGGIWETKNKLVANLPGIPHENTSKTGILHKNGIISLARTDTGTASTEFFICIGDQHGLDSGGKRNPDGQGFAAFGKVLKGMDVVRKIHQQPEYQENLDPPIPIKNIVRK